VQLAQGPDRKIIEYNPVIGRTKEQFARTYTWITWQENGDYFCSWPEHGGKVVMFEDDFYRDNIWVREGKPCWIYENMGEIKLIQNRDEIEWTPNTIESEVAIEGTSANITLTSDTPNLKEYQVMDVASGRCEKSDDKVLMELSTQKHELLFRALNLAGVSGPVHTIIIERK